MHILFLTDNFPPEVNASASRVYERACYWVKWGHEVTVLTSAPNFPEGKVYPGYKNCWVQTEIMDGIRVVRVKTYIAPNQGKIRRILDFLSYMIMAFCVGLRHQRYDIIMATSPQFFTAVAGYYLAKTKRKPFIFELGDLWPASIRAVGAMKSSRVLRWVEKFELHLYRQSQHVVALTQAFKTDLVNRGIAANKISVIPNGVDLPRLQPGPKPEVLLNKYQLHGKVILAYIGTHGMAHGLERVIALAEKSQKMPWIFLLVGAGAEREHLIALAEQQQLNNVIFIEKQNKQQLQHYWNLCDIALISLKNDPTFKTVIPSKIFEAMAMHKPQLLLGPSGEASALLEQHQTGLHLTQETLSELNTLVMALLSGPYQQRCKTACEQHSREQQAIKVLNVLEHC